MTPENKKIAMYLGGAIAIGAVGFFVYSFFQKPIVVGNTTVVLGEEEQNANAPIVTPPTATTNPFKEMLNQFESRSPTPFGDMFRDKNWSLVY
jgi:hypothetical protein